MATFRRRLLTALRATGAATAFYPDDLRSTTAMSTSVQRPTANGSNGILVESLGGGGGSAG
jgi:hypothetical protein